jgi:hypothetical protein
MRYQYHIQHVENGKSPHDQAMRPISATELRHEYDFLPNYLEHCSVDNLIMAAWAGAPSPLVGLIVTLESNETAEYVQGQLARWLIGINRQKEGLCLVADPYYQP